ncbi:hypothetical protein ACEWY4_021041 [Coilia grayii]|uniref:ribonuclease H n=1 Tax=Coilia grayii TaxID=363190 RepID=A0ABD1JB76_9TELE
MAHGLRRIDPLVFDENIADNWCRFEKEWTIYCNAGLSDKSEKVQAYTLLNLAGAEAAEKSESFRARCGNCNGQHSPDRSKCFFQNVMEQLFAGQPCEIVVDDILVWGRTLQEHDGRLTQVMNRIRAINLKLNPEKCKFRVNSVHYVGHLLTADGVKPDPEKVKAVCEMEKPQDKQALQQFLGMTNYLSKFIPQYSDTTGPLRQLIHHDVEWHWHDAHDAAFSKLKQALTNPPVLQFFDTSKPVVISADASQHGLGAVCLQQGRPVAFASRALTPTESRKPLHTASPRLQRYDLDVMYKRGKELFVADALSRAHLPESEPPLTDDLLEVMTVQVLPSRRTDELRDAVKSDVTCQQLSEVIVRGWPSTSRELPQQLRPFFSMKEELTLVDGLLLRGQRSAKHLLEKCHRDGMDIQAAILHTRNVPRDGLPSSAQRLMSRRTRTFLSSTTDMLRPTVQVNVAAAIIKHRTRGKAYHDRSAHRLPALKPGQMVRVQTERRFDQVARVEGPAQQPNSYVIASQGKSYIRNRRHLLKVNEDPPASDEEDVPLRSTLLAPDGENNQDANTLPTPPSPLPVTPVVNTARPSERQLVVTRVGRISQPSQRYQDYVRT